MVTEGWATREGTERFKNRHLEHTSDTFFRQTDPWFISSMGLGTYLGEPTEEDDNAYETAVKDVVKDGINHLDTAINYRFQRSERSIGHALDDLFSNDELQRDEIIVASKGGFVPFDGEAPSDPSLYLQENFLKTGVAKADDFVGGSHCMAPGYLEHQLNRSRNNLNLDTLDMYYVHNPETQFQELDDDEFYDRLADAFEVLELLVDDEHLRFYGLATWNALRVQPGEDEYIDLERVLQLAEEVGGDNHHFKGLQLPYNLAMPEALTLENQTDDRRRISTVEFAREHDLIVNASATLLQGKLIDEMPEQIRSRMPELDPASHCAIQFTRSAPGITSALIGMKTPEHIEENTILNKQPPFPEDEYLDRFFVEMDQGS